MNQTGLLFIISSPSGGGKDSVINALIKMFPDSTRVITTTTRAPRPGNINGVDYHFITPEEFKQKLATGDFVEHNVYGGNYYGMQKKHLAELLATHPIVFTQIDVNGKHQLDDAHLRHVSIFLIPDNLETLRQRILARGGLTPKAIEERMKIAAEEITAAADYEYKIINKNGKMPETVAKIAEIIEKRTNQRRSIDNKGEIG